MANDAEAPDGADAAAPAKRPHPIDSVAGQVRHLSTGDRAQLRRLYLTQRHEADGIVVGLLHRAGVTEVMRADAFRPWRLIVHCAALLSGTGTTGAPAHANAARLGEILHQIGYSENRLSRLLATRGDTLAAQVIRGVRMIGQRGKGPINLRTLFALIGDNVGAADAARLRIAQEYYAADARSKQETPNDD